MERYWKLPGHSNKFATLPRIQIPGKPIPTTWAGVGTERARALGAVEYCVDTVPPFYSIREGVDPYSVTTVDGVQTYTLDLSLLEYDESAATAAQEKTIRAERDRRLAALTWRVERHQSEVRLGLTPTDAIEIIDACLQNLRDIPAQAGFPWGGDVSAAPWPDELGE